MEYEYLKYPRSVVVLAEELKRVANDYDARRINNEELKAIVVWYAEECAEKLFQGKDYNRSIKKIIGKRRIDLLDTVLSEYRKMLVGRMR